MPYMTRLEADIRAEFGDYYETVPGWKTRGSSSFAPAGTLCHWTAGPKTGDRPSLRVCAFGREDLSGPLCNVFLTREGKPIIVAAGRANHAGPGSYASLRGNSAWYGIEAESSGVEGDRNWTTAQRRNYPRLVAAMQRGLKRDERTVAGHSEYAEPRGRKVDINGYPMSAMRASVREALARPGSSGAAITPLPETPKDWLMALTDAEQKRLLDRVDVLFAERTTGRGLTADQAAQANQTAVDAREGRARAELNTTVVNAAFDKLVVALEAQGSLTREQVVATAAGLADIRDVVREGVAAGLAEADDAQVDDIADGVVSRIAGRLAGAAA